MTFFDKKSEVIAIELTSYGKYLLSKGKFKPVYYEFLDSDILYDSSYVGVNETRNDISTRIKTGTPSTRPQYIFTGVETKLKQLLKTKSQLEKQRKASVKDEELIENIQTFEKLYINSTPLGNSNFDEKYPALGMYIYNTTIKNSKLYKQNNSHIVNIPEITLNNTNLSSSILVADTAELLRLRNIEENQPPLETQLSPQQTVTSNSSAIKIFPDNTYISIEDKSLLLQFFEDNAPIGTDNFEIEIYTYETSSEGSETIKQLYFTKNGETTDDTTRVEYYFDITTDGNIQSSVLEPVKQKKKPVVFQLL